jgi:2-hydroxychromene-2-carboxylate isomerase
MLSEAGKIGLGTDDLIIRATGLFKANDVQVGTGQSFADTMNDTKRKYMSMDLYRFVKERQVELKWPSHHPRSSVLALRTLLYITNPESGYKGKQITLWDAVKRFYRAYWVEGIDISDEQALGQLLSSLGVSPDAVQEAASNNSVKEELKKRTQEGVDRGLFGVPTFFVTIDGVLNDRLIYGQDQLELLENVLGCKSHLDELFDRPRSKLHPTTFYFDFSSPYTYLAYLKIEKLFGAKHVKFVPVLLGAIFKGVGQHNTPAATMSPARQSWSSSELFRQFSELGAQFNWASRFPIRTIVPLRLVIAAGPDTDDGRKLIGALFEAFWVNDLDSNDPQVCEKVANDIGLDGKALLAKANSIEVKESLHKNTSTAITNGVFGLPMVRQGLHHRRNNTRYECF